MSSCCWATATARSPYHEANQAVELAVADLTGNGSKDIIYADQGLDRVVVDYGAGNSTVLADQSTGLLEPGAVALADLNGDGIPDLIVANSGSNNVLIYPGLGNGQFGPAINGGNGYFVGTNPVGITVANLTGHARPGGGRRRVQRGLDPARPGFGERAGPCSPGPRLKSGGPGPTAVGHHGRGPTDILVTNADRTTSAVQRVSAGLLRRPASRLHLPRRPGPGAALPRPTSTAARDSTWSRQRRLERPDPDHRPGGRQIR